MSAAGTHSGHDLDDPRERARLRALRDFGLPDGEHPAADDLAALVAVAAAAAGVPTAAIHLLAGDEQRALATVGFEIVALPRRDSMCSIVVDEPRPVVVADAREDPRFSANPFVREGRVRFYAAFQLRTAADVSIGTLCVFDDRPQVLGAEQRSVLQALADRVVGVLELDRRVRELTGEVRELEEVRAGLRADNESLRAFAGQVSHDLRAPLSTMTLSLELLGVGLAQGWEPSDLEPVLARALRGATRMRGVVENLFVHATGAPASPHPVDLGSLVEDAREDLGPALDGVDVTARALPVVVADGPLLRLVLQNLLSNAAKFAATDHGGEVSVTASRRDRSWLVEVADHGRGVPETEREHVFEAFARVGEHAELAPGTGLGLATCRAIIEAHGGRIGLRETAGGGATVWFELPDPR